ncbi:DsbA family oxidoreductase [Nocardioides zeae]|uniref:DsbA family dithiol-disulfide isomerase n=1 Tax=Nocardioides zeae TaxID=1457234 RepID=A0AAJ1U4L0_9ACTN|nr:DsbA family oxidoreductase [Nocardioides zeae]MDQ1105028.1 putative DsbA family dithiol-disulfide isomerase [Nocardioides zeae]
MRIEIWSDVVCPWCFIGKRRMETALASFEHADEVEVVYRSFELDPTAPRNGTERTVDALTRKYGPQAPQMMAQVDGIARQEGLDFHQDRTVHGNTVDAHRLLHLALAEGGPAQQVAVKEAFLSAYFEHARNLSDPAELRAVALEAGLPAERVDEVLASDEYADAVAADVQQARAFGATGVPFFVVDRAFGVSGAQSVEVFTQVLERAWAQSHPSLVQVGGDDADACGPDGCAVPGA